MPSVRDHIEAWRNAKAAGDEEAAAYIHEQIVAAQQAQDRTDYNPTSDESTVGLVQQGVGRGMMNVARNVGNIVGLQSDRQMADAAAIDAPLMATGAGKAGNFIGETAAVALPTMGAAGLLGRGAGVVGNIARNAVGRGAIEGVVQGAITGGPEHRVGGATIGAVTGAALPALGVAYKAARSGVNPSASARRLMRGGVELTPGQMNPRGALNQVEEVAQSVPYLGKIVGTAREKGYKQFQQKVMQDVAPPGVTIPLKDDVTSMVADVSKSYDSAYDVAKGFPVHARIVRTAGGDIPLSQAFKNVVSFKGTRAKDDERKAVMGFLSNELSQLRGRSIKSDDLLKVRSNIRTELRGLEATSGEYKILKNAEAQVTQALESQLPNAAMKSLKATDAQYGKFKIVEDAVYRAKDQTGSFTPAQFSQAIRSATSKSEYAKGGGRMRDLSQSAVDVFQPKQPLTGRQVATIAPFAVAAYAHPLGAGLPIAAGTAMMYGTQAGRRFAAGQTANQLFARQLERELRKAVPKTGREVIAGYGRNALVNLTTGD